MRYPPGAAAPLADIFGKYRRIISASERTLSVRVSAFLIDLWGAVDVGDCDVEADTDGGRQSFPPLCSYLKREKGMFLLCKAKHENGNKRFREIGSDLTI